MLVIIKINRYLRKKREKKNHQDNISKGLGIPNNKKFSYIHTYIVFIFLWFIVYYWAKIYLRFIFFPSKVTINFN